MTIKMPAAKDKKNSKSGVTAVIGLPIRQFLTISTPGVCPRDSVLVLEAAQLTTVGSSKPYAMAQ